jgi:hypothetical protein
LHGTRTDVLQSSAQAPVVVALHREGEGAVPDRFSGGGLLAGYAHLHLASSVPSAEYLLNS